MAEMAIQPTLHDSNHCKSGFSYDCQYYAAVSTANQLTLWNSKNRKLLQTHDFLSNQLICIAWSPPSTQIHDSPKPPRKKSKTHKKDAQIATTYLLAGASLTGCLAILDVNKVEVCRKMDNGHHAKVTCINWSRQNRLYSASDDGLVIIWDVDSGQLKTQWKAENSPIHAISSNDDGTKLILASRSIKVWDVATQQMLTKYTGHVNAVRLIKMLPSKRTCSTEYFISGAERDKFLNVWQLSTEKSTIHNPLATLALTDQLVSLECKLLNELSIAAICRDGQMHIFYISINGSKRKKPLSPTSSIQMVTPSDKNSTPIPVPMFNAQFYNEASQEPLLRISYGSFINPSYEDLDISKCEPNCCLIRDIPKNLLLTTDKTDKSDNVSSVQSNSKATAIVGPVNMKLSNAAVTKKTKRTNESSDEITFQERLNAAKAQTRINSTGSLPTADSLSQMLIQAVHSQDNRLLDSVLQNNKEIIIRNTIKRVPITLILPFLKEVIKRFEANPNRGGNLILWLKITFTVHTSYLITLPNLEETLGALYNLIEDRLQSYNKLAKLEGRLEVMLTQLQSQQDSTTHEQYIPLNVYEESDTESESYSSGASSSENDDQLMNEFSSSDNGKDDVDSIGEDI